jgi:putative transposase
MPPRRYPSTKAVVKYVPLLDQQFRARKRPVGSSWRMDETYVKVKGR